jgi:hypothetical protein
VLPLPYGTIFHVLSSLFREIKVDVDVDVGSWETPELADTIASCFQDIPILSFLYPCWRFSLFIFCASDFIDVSEIIPDHQTSRFVVRTNLNLQHTALSQVCQHLPRYEGRVEYSWGSRVFFAGLASIRPSTALLLARPSTPPQRELQGSHTPCPPNCTTASTAPPSTATGSTAILVATRVDLLVH